MMVQILQPAISIEYVKVVDLTVKVVQEKNTITGYISYFLPSSLVIFYCQAIWFLAVLAAGVITVNKVIRNPKLVTSSVNGASV
jgi:hypothetical protein